MGFIRARCVVLVAVSAFTLTASTASALTLDPLSNATTTEGTPLQFTASASGVGPLTYQWDWGDGSPSSSGATASHSWFLDGVFSIVLTVTDTATSLVEISSATVTVFNSPPVIHSLTSYVVTEVGQQFTLTGIASDPGGDTLTYFWDLDADGTYEFAGVDLYSVMGSYSSEGFFVGSLEVRDSDGAVAQQSFTVRVPEPMLGLRFLLASLPVSLAMRAWRRAP